MNNLQSGGDATSEKGNGSTRCFFAKDSEALTKAERQIVKISRGFIHLMPVEEFVISCHPSSVTVLFVAILTETE
jgi:hypothetical protein